MPRTRVRLVAAVFLATALVARPAHAQLFGPRVDLDTGPVPREVAVGDIDRDGHADIAVAVQGADVVSIFYGNGNLTFRPRVDIAVRPGPLALALVDWTGDTNLDLLVGAVSDTTLSVYVGNGAGGFVAGASVKCPTIPYEIETTDVTGDGRLDAIVAADEITVALFDVAGTAGGGFGVPRVLIAASGHRSRSIAVGQIDGQLGPDIYFSSTSGTSRVLYSDGAGGYLAPVDVSGSGPTEGVALGDFDGDARLDVIEVGPGLDFQDSKLRHLRGLPGGGFVALQSFQVGPSPSSPAIADFNLDGRSDVAFLAGFGTQVYVSLNVCILDAPAGANVDLSALDLALGDFDEDGDVDYVSSNQGGASVSVRRNDGGAVQCTAFPLAVPASIDFGLAPMDLVGSRELRIQNTGDSPLLLLDASLATAAFEHDPFPATAIPADGYVILEVRALRPGLGVFEDTLVVRTNSPELPFLEVPLRAEGRLGLPANLVLDPTSLVFPPAGQGFPAERSVTIQNLGETTAHLTGGTFDGTEFSVSETFPLAVGPGGEVRTIIVTCAHATIGTFSDTLRIATDAPGTPVLIVPVSTSTRVAQPDLVYSPTSIVFPPGTLSVVGFATLDVQNTGDLDLVLSTPQFGTAEFGVGQSYPQTIAPGETRQLGVHHLRTTLGMRQDTLRLATNVPGVPHVTIPLSGEVNEGTPQPGFPTLVDFGSGLIGSTTQRTVTLTNTGDAAYMVLGATASPAEFTVLGPVSLTVLPGGTAHINLNYTRATPGTLHGLLQLQTNTPITPMIQLQGIAIPTAPSAHLQSDSLNFGILPVGGAVERTARVVSDGVGPVTVLSVAAASPDITVVTTLPLSVPEGGSSLIRFRVIPSVAGPFSELAYIRTNEMPDSILTVTLIGDVRPPAVVDLDPGTIDPVELALGATTSVPITLRNLGPEWPLSGSATVRIDSVTTIPAGPPMVADARQTRFDGEGHEWDIEPDGSIATGDTAAFAGGLDWFTIPAAGSSILRDGGRTIQLGPTTVGTRDFTRSIHVPLSGAWIRYVDTVRNRSNAPISFHIFIQSTIAPANALIARTSSGSLSLLPQVDDWAVLADEAGPAIGHVFAGPGAQRPSSASFGSGTSQGVSYVYLVQIPPKTSVSILHFALQAPTLGVGMARAEALRNFGGGALAGLSALERAQIVNFAVPKPISIPPTSFLLNPLASLSTAINFDAGAVSGEETVFGSLRVATNDPVTPLLVVPLELRILGTPDVIGVGPDGPALVLAARFLPNPASGRGVRLAYALPTEGDARFDLYDVRGRRLASRTLVAAPAGPGWLDWTGRAADGGVGLALAPGVYWTRLTHAGKSVITKGVVLN